MLDLQTVRALYGRPINVVPDRPKRVLSKDVPVTDEFRAEIDAWMIEFFGVENPLPDGAIIQTIDGFIHMNPRTLELVLFDLNSLAQNAMPPATT